jgi:ComF family protein
MRSQTDTHPMVRTLIRAALDLIYPPRCVTCGQLGAWLCARCLGDMPVIREPLCSRCGKPLQAPGLCVACVQSTWPLSAIRSLSPHVPPLREAIHALKYEGARVLAEPLGELLAEFWPKTGIRAEVVVPVPLHKVRERQRGYNQSLLLAQAFGKQAALPVHTRAVARERNTRSQVGLSPDERWANVWGAFRCLTEELRGAHTLLIDDVLTTGATLEACAAALLEAGSAEVYALTLTRALRLSGPDGVLQL